MSAGDVNVEVSTQRIVVEPATSSVSVIKAGPQGPSGVGAGGVGLPVGGTAEQVLAKVDSANFNAEWTTLKGLPPGGSADQVLSKVDSVDYNVDWAILKGVPSGGTAGQILYKVDGTDHNIAWGDPPGVAIGWTPVITQNSNGNPLSITNIDSNYSIIGDWVIGNFSILVGSAGSSGTVIKISLPVTAAAVQGNIGVGGIYDDNTGIRYPAILDMISTTQMWLSDSTLAGGSWALGNCTTFTGALASPDNVAGSFRYKWT